VFVIIITVTSLMRSICSDQVWYKLSKFIKIGNYKKLLIIAFNILHNIPHNV